MGPAFPELGLLSWRSSRCLEQGAKFDLKDFHDVVLGSGALPRDILERNVNQWISDKKTQASSGAK